MNTAQPRIWLNWGEPQLFKAVRGFDSISAAEDFVMWAYVNRGRVKKIALTPNAIVNDLRVDPKDIEWFH